MSAIPSWARVGAKVVFISDIRPKDMRGVAAFPKKGGIYTIREVRVAAGRGYLLLREIVNPTIWTSDAGYAERAAEIELFRPLITQQDDIETHFKALLDVPEQVGA
jgi:hypothetical protein